MRRVRRLSLALLLIGATAFALYWTWGRGPRLRTPLVENVPADAVAYVRVDVRAILRSQLWRRLVTDRGGDRGLARLRERCGVDPSAQVDELAAFVGSDGPRSLDHVTFLARGPFDHDALGDCMRQIIEEDGGGLRRVEVDDVPAVAGARGDSRMAFLGRDGIVFGAEPSVRRVLATVRGDSPRVEGVVKALHDDVVGSDIPEVVLAAAVPEHWQQALRERMGNDLPEPLRAALAGLRGIGAGARVSRGLALGLRLRFDDAAHADEIVGLVRRQRDVWLDDPLVQLSGAAGVLRRAGLEARGVEVVAAIDLDDATLDRVIEAAPRLLR